MRVCIMSSEPTMPGEQVVEVVRDAAGELAHRLHLLRLAQGLLGLTQRLRRRPLRSDVAADGVEQSLLRHCGPGDQPVATVLGAEAVLEPEGLGTLVKARKLRECALDIVRMDEPKKVAGEQLRLGPAEDRRPGRVDGNQRSVRAAYVHQVRAELPDLIPFLGALLDLGLQGPIQAPQCFLGAPTFLDLALGFLEQASVVDGYGSPCGKPRYEPLRALVETPASACPKNRPPITSPDRDVTGTAK